MHTIVDYKEAFDKVTRTKLFNLSEEDDIPMYSVNELKRCNGTKIRIDLGNNKCFKKIIRIQK
jgi:hypothetical protein